MTPRAWIGAALVFLLACAPEQERPDVALEAPACRIPDERTTVRAENGAILETWEFPLAWVQTDRLPDEPAYQEFRAAVLRDSADLREPVADAPIIDSDELSAIWADEFFNRDLVFDEGVGSIEAISCLDALLFARQAGRVSQLERPTEFSASVLHRETGGGVRVAVVFAAGTEMFVPRGFYGFDVVADLMAQGWEYGYAIHNHTLQAHGPRIALGVPVPSTSDVQLLRSVSADLGLDSVRVTNGFYTFRAAVADLERFRSR